MMILILQKGDFGTHDEKCLDGARKIKVNEMFCYRPKSRLAMSNIKFIYV